LAQKLEEEEEKSFSDSDQTFPFSLYKVEINNDDLNPFSALSRLVVLIKRLRI